MNAAEKALIFKKVGHQVNDEQWAIHRDPAPLRLVAGGERGGKSATTGADFGADMLDCELGWIVGPDYEQTHAEFEYALALLQHPNVDAVQPDTVSMPKHASWSMRLRTGALIETKTSKEIMALASKAPDRIAMVEAAQQDFEAFKKLWNRGAESRASRGTGTMIVSGTFETSLGWYAEMFNELQHVNTYGGHSYSLPSWSNRFIFKGGRRDPEIVRLEATNPPDVFLERFGGIPCPPAGLVFREFRTIDHVVPIRFQPGMDRAARDQDGWVLPEGPLELWVDPGYAGAYAVLFVAIVNALVFVVDEVYARGWTVEQVIIESMRHKALWERVKGGVIDIAARQHQGMESHEEVWRRLAKQSLRSEAVPIVDGISRHRTFLRDPFTQTPRIFHDPKCVGTIKEYGLYRYPKRTDAQAETELPVDKDNHAMKAIAYGLSNHFGFVDRLSNRKQGKSLIGERSLS